MNPVTKVIGKTITHGKNVFEVDSKGNWRIYAFGTFSPADKGIPRYGLISIPSDKVPKEVKSLVKQ